MRTLLITLLSLSSLASLSACEKAQPGRTAKEVSPRDQLVGELNGMEADVRIAAATKRIEDLERKVGELEATPQKIDIELLTQRVAALEGKAAAPVAPATDTPLPRDRSASPQPALNLPRPTQNTTLPSQRSSKLKLPELEGRPRLATPAETKAFSTEKQP